MKTFLIATGVLLFNMFFCGFSTFSQNTSLLAIGFITFLFVLWFHGFTSARSGVSVRIGTKQPDQQPAQPRKPVRRLEKPANDYMD